MSSSIRKLGFFAALLALAQASPFALLPRADKTVTYENEDDETMKEIYYAPKTPTCGNDNDLSGPPVDLSTDMEVDVRRDCDPVIHQICEIAVAQADRSFSYNIGATVGNCEGHFLKPYTDTYELDYDACVAGFQNVTTTCMLVDDPKVKNSAKVGQQFGVKNVWYDQMNAEWKASAMFNNLPGYMMGASKVFGAVNEKNVSDFDPLGFLKPDLRI